MSGKYEKKRRPPQLKQWQWILLAVCAVFAVMALIAGLRMRKCCGALITQSAAETWKGESEGGYGQISVFLPEEDTIPYQTVLSFRETLKDELKAAGKVLPEDAPEGASLTVDAYTAVSRLSLFGVGGRSVSNARTFGVGGNFFLFHPLRLVSGSYLTPDALMKDRVVLDTGLAWALFGGIDVAGMTVTIGERPYLIAGVVEIEDDFATQAAYTDDYVLFMDFDALAAISEAEISCYEAVIPEPFDGFADTVVTEKFPATGSVVVDNTHRYSLRNLFRVIGDYGKRSMSQNTVVFPYWENAARMTEDHAAFAMIMTILFGVLPGVCTVVVAIRFVIRSVTETKDRLTAQIERRSEKEKEKHYVRGGI